MHLRVGSHHAVVAAIRIYQCKRKVPEFGISLRFCLTRRTCISVCEDSIEDLKGPRLFIILSFTTMNISCGNKTMHLWCWRIGQKQNPLKVLGSITLFKHWGNISIDCWEPFSLNIGETPQLLCFYCVYSDLCLCSAPLWCHLFLLYLSLYY